ncbi:MAG: phospholipase D family protein [Proteobacteria bacterium]|nr:phospholipase D family protein [Pseudomonadota bacterium]
MIKNISRIISCGLLLALLLTGGCATLPENYDRPITYAYAETEDTAFGEARRDEKAAHPGESGFMLLENGLDAFVARAVLSHHAERSIDVQYFLIHDDMVAKLFVDQLLKAADRGVRVRLLVDDIDLGGRDLGAAILDSHPNMEVRIFNPFSRKASRFRQLFTRFGSVTRRMHNKSFTVDNQVAILGGRNIGDEYFSADPVVAFSDLDVLTIGPVVKEVSKAFDLYWNDELAYPAIALRGEPPTPKEIKRERGKLDYFVARQNDSPYLQALQEADLSEEIRKKKVRYTWGKAEIIYDQPEKLEHDFDKKELHIAPKIKAHMDSTREELIVFTPYFVPRRSGVEYLKQLRSRGVRVRILTNSLASNNHAFVHAGYAKHRKEMLQAGVELYELNIEMLKKNREGQNVDYGKEKTVLHAKSFVFDRQKVFIGSLNLDPRSIDHNTEIGLVLTSENIATRLAGWFDQNIERVAFRLALQANEKGYEKIVWHGWEDGEKVTYDEDPHTGFWLRFYVGFLEFLPIDSQL